MTEIDNATADEKFRLGVSIKTAELNRARTVSFWRKRRRWLISGAGILAAVIATIIILDSQPRYTVAAEVPKIMAAQEGLKFGILIPTYIPRGFDRANVELKVDPTGPNGVPVADLTYRNTGRKAAIFLRQWIPGDPTGETLYSSRPIETRWGNGFLRTMSNIASLWVDIGQLRVEVAASPISVVPPEQLLQIANTLGLATDDQVYSFKTELVEIRSVAPAPPFVVPVNAEGIQELNLTLTPGGYSPVRFVLKKGIPARITFRALGFASAQIIIMPLGDGNSKALMGATGRPAESFDFTPQNAGDLQFNCEHNTYRGIMMVRD